MADRPPAPLLRSCGPLQETFLTPSARSEHGRRLPDGTFADMLDAARAGAGWACERIFTTLAPPVAGYLRLRGVADPEGTTNDVFLGVFRGLDRFEGDEQQFRRWVFTIAHHRLVDERRRVARRPAEVGWDALAHDPPGGNVEDDALAGIEQAWVRQVLDTLTPAQRDVILLRVLGDLTIEQVADVLGKRPGAIKQLQRRGLDTLRQSRNDVTLAAKTAIAEVT